MAASDKPIDMKKLLKDVIVVTNPDESTRFFRDVFDRLPEQRLEVEYKFPDHPIIPGKPIVFNDEECFVGPGDFSFKDMMVMEIKVSKATYDWFDKLLGHVKDYNAKAEVRAAVKQYGEEHQITDIGARFLFKLWLAKLTFFGAISGYCVPNAWASVGYFWRQPDAWCWMWADGMTVDEAIIEDITSGY